MPSPDIARIERQLSGPERNALAAWSRACGCEWQRVPSLLTYLETVAIAREAEQEARIYHASAPAALIAACRRFGYRTVETYTKRIRRWRGTICPDGGD